MVVEEVTLPRGALVGMAVRSELRPSVAAVGDQVEATLTGDIKQGKVKLVPKGATVKGRIVEAMRADRYMLMIIRFTDIEWAGHHAAMTASFERRGVLQSRPTVLPVADGSIVLPMPLPGSMKGDLLLYRTAK